MLLRALARWSPAVLAGSGFCVNIAVISVLSAGLISSVRADTLVIQGSTTFNARLMEPYQRAIESMAGVNLKIIPNKSQNGLTALLAGRADLAMISSPLETELSTMRLPELAGALEQLQGHLITNTRVSFAVHPSNPVRKASLETLRRVLLGEIVNWRELGGPDLPIKVAFVGKAGGVTQTVISQVLDNKQIRAALTLPLNSAEQVVKVVEQEPGAMGLAQVRLVAEKNLPEIATDATVAQVLMLVTLGRPSVAASGVIEAARTIASKRLAASDF